MKTIFKKHTHLFLLGALLIVISHSCSPYGKTYKPVATINDTISINNSKQPVQIDFYKGRAFNHPIFAVWIEDMEGNYLETLFVTKSIAMGIYNRGQLTDTTWSNKPGAAQRPAALPYWMHKKGRLSGDNLLPSEKHPFTDAVSGATPKSDFTLKTGPVKEIPRKFRILMEINQTWDWNEYWSNTKFPDDKEYKSSAQPSLVYAVSVDKDQTTPYYLNPIGHGSYNGKDGELHTDLTTFTTALNIAYKIEVHLK